MCIDRVVITTHIATPTGTTDGLSSVTITNTGTIAPNGIIAIGAAATALDGGATGTETLLPSRDTGGKKQLGTKIQR